MSMRSARSGYRLSVVAFAVLAVAAPAVSGCGESETDTARANFEAGMRDSMEARGAPGSYIECVVEGTRTAITDEQMESFNDTDQFVQQLPALGPAMQQVGLDCQTKAVATG